MPIRIYALAKELKLDSKQLVDICERAGITGKGSALASLTDEEVVKIREVIGGGKARAGARPATTSRPEPSGPAPVRREDYLAPAGTSPARVPVLPTKGDKPPVKKKEEAPTEAVEERPVEKVEKAAPVIKMAPMPVVQQPPKPIKDEPAPQKPDIKLPLDAIRASREGLRPLAEQLRKAELKRKASSGVKASPRGPAPVSETPSPATPAKPPREKAPADTDKERPRRGGGRGGVAAEAPSEQEGGAANILGREQRQLKRKRAATSRRPHGPGEETEETASRPRRNLRIRRTGANNTAAPRKTSIVVQLPISVREFSEAIGIPAKAIQAKLLSMGQLVPITAQIDQDLAELLAAEFGAEVSFRHAVDLEEQVIGAVEQQEDRPEDLQPRAPIVTVLGHVDHGKTSLLDRIIGMNVAAGERGGITQHIRAYRVPTANGDVTFVDTPGHEAFTEMRARGANVTDIAVVVVAADDGVMPQTEEAISHARAAGVPIVVALNKMDLPGINVDRIMQQLAANDLLPSQWGGDVEVIPTSAVTGLGIDNLLDTLLTVAELHEWTANPARPAIGTCLEAELHEDRGVVAKVLVQNGTLHVGDIVVCGQAYGRVKALYDTRDVHKKYTEASPSTPVNITGLHVAPNAGDRFYVLSDVTQARELADKRAQQNRQEELSETQPHVTLETLFDRLGDQENIQTLNIILRADVRGSIEAIRKELGKLEHPEVQIKILQATVGGITEADVYLADASDAVIIGFNVVPDEGARVLAEQRRVQIRRYDIIYQVTDDLRAALEGMLKPEKQIQEIGRALVQVAFSISKVGTVAGCRVLGGNITRDARMRIVRDSRVIGDYAIDSLRREKDDVREVREGMECGIKLAGFNDIKEGDLLEGYRIAEVKRTL